MPRELFAGQQLVVPPRLLRLGSVVAIVLVSAVHGLYRRGRVDHGAQLSAITRAFGAQDPIFHQDIGFYVFELPVLRVPARLGVGLIVLTAIGAAAHLRHPPDLLSTDGQRFKPDPRVVAHFTLSWPWPSCC